LGWRLHCPVDARAVARHRRRAADPAFALTAISSERGVPDMAIPESGRKAIIRLLKAHGRGSLLLALCLIVDAGAADLDESLRGDLSGDRMAPTRWVLDHASTGSVPGSNVLTGTTGRIGGVVDRDYLHVVVPAGHEWVGLRVGNQTTVGGGGSFIGLATGPFMPVAPDAADATGLLGFRVHGVADRNTDILPAMAGGGGGASGFALPLAAGDYAVWIQELAPGAYTYRFNFVIAPVPEPASALLAAIGLGAVALCLHRRQRGSRG